jgi:hypothetical protein
MHRTRLLPTFSIKNKKLLLSQNVVPREQFRATLIPLKVSVKEQYMIPCQKRKSHSSGAILPERYVFARV